MSMNFYPQTAYPRSQSNLHTGSIHHLFREIEAWRSRRGT
jgi:hypothetical protein